MWNVADGSDRRDVFSERFTGSQYATVVCVCWFYVFNRNSTFAGIGNKLCKWVMVGLLNREPTRNCLRKAENMQLCGTQSKKYQLDRS